MPSLQHANPRHLREPRNTMRYGHQSLKSGRGMVLPSVLWITVLTIVVATNYASSVHLGTRSVDNIKTRTLARHDSVSGIYIGLERLLADPRNTVDGYRFELNGNTVEVGISAENGKTSLNEADDTQLRGAFAESGADSETAALLAARVLDWRDPDHSPRALGMEDADYQSSGKPYGAADGHIRDLVEVLLMADLDPALFRSIQDRLTVYSQRSSDIYSLTSRVSDAGGRQIYVTRVIVQLVNHPAKPYRVLKWRYQNG